MSPYFTHGVAQCEFWMQAETCCMRLAEMQDAKTAKNSPSAQHRTTLSGYIFANKAGIDNRTKTC